MKAFVALQCVFLVMFLVGCAGKGPAGNTAESLYKEAEEALADENYILARDKFREVRNRYPYSSRAIDAELRIADSFFEEESYIEAESAYEVFRELHPTYRRIDYVEFRIAMSAYHQIPSNTARDLTPAYRAIDQFNQVATKYPKTKYAKMALEYRQKSRSQLAEHENYVANFYFQRRHYLSSSYRYAALMRDFPGLGYDEEALYRLGECYYHIRMYSNARNTLRRLLKSYPSGQYASNAKGLLGKLEGTQ